MTVRFRKSLRNGRSIPAHFGFPCWCLIGIFRIALSPQFKRNTENPDALDPNVQSHNPCASSITVGLDILAARDPKCAPMCIMVVDDEALVRMATADTLRDAGFVVVEASGTCEALLKFGDGLVFRDL